MMGSKTKSSFSFPFLALHVLLVTTTIPGVVFASKPQQQQQQLSDADSKPAPALASLSSLFNAKASPTRDFPDAKVSICCGDSCCPLCCDEDLVRPTDLAYAYPAPTPPPSGQKAPSFNTQRPCCTLGCADGACRLPQATRSQRPETTPPPPGSADRTMTTAPKATDTLNIVIGCCSTCKNCDQLVTSVPNASFLAAAATARAAVRRETNNDLEEKAPLGPGEEAVCIGCGKCTPCDEAVVLSYLSFQPRPSGTPGDDDPHAFVDAVSLKKIAATSTRSRSSSSSSSSSTTSTDPEPTYYLGDDVNDAINGQNQDILPVIVQSGDGKNPELVTLLATIDFTLQENYISRRMLSQLALTDKVANFPRGVAPQIAFLDFHQDKSVINASIVLDLVTGNAAAGTQGHFSNVRFFVYGGAPTETDEGTIRIPDVILGQKFFRAVGGLTVFPSFKTQVENGVKIVYPVHRGTLGGVRLEAATEDEGNEEGNSGEKHDEL